MATDRQIKFLLNRFNNNKRLVIQYLEDLCKDIKVLDLARNYKTNHVQIQRDRNNFIHRKVVPNILEKLNKNSQI